MVLNAVNVKKSNLKMKIKRQKPTKKLWWLYLIFLATFCFGDLVSTSLIIQFKPTVTISEECVCKLPSECDISPVIQESTTLGFLMGIKLIVAVIFLLLLFFTKTHKITGYIMLMLSQLGIFAIIGNLSIYYWKFAPLFFYLLAIFSIFVMLWFTEPKWMRKIKNVRRRNNTAARKKK